MEEKVGFGCIKIGQNFAPGVFTGLARKEILGWWDCAAMDDVVEGEVGAVVGEEEADAQELHACRRPVFVGVD